MHKFRREIEKDKKQRFDEKKILKIIVVICKKSKIEIISEVFYQMMIFVLYEGIRTYTLDLEF